MVFQIIQGDCQEVLKKFEAASIDMVLTSPPYDNMRTYNASLEWGEHVWKPVIQELFRVVKDGSVVVWIVGDATVEGSETGTSFKQALWAKECGFKLHDTMFYMKKGGLNSGSLQAYQQKIEYMFVFVKGKIKTYNLIKDRPNKHTEPRKKLKKQKDGTYKEQMVYTSEFGVRYNVWEYQTGKYHSTHDTEALTHPAIFPEKLARDHILSWSNEGNIILDPFAGSGTVGKMAKQLNRSYIMIEKAPQYVGIMNRRLLPT